MHFEFAYWGYFEWRGLSNWHTVLTHRPKRGLKLTFEVSESRNPSVANLSFHVRNDRMPNHSDYVNLFVCVLWRFMIYGEKKKQ